MQKVCDNWPERAFSDDLVQAKYWQEFAANAKAAAAELHRVPDMAAAQSELEKLIKELGAKKVVAVGGEESAAVAGLYQGLALTGASVYTDKFEIAEQAPQADLGISVGEFGVGETGSVCVDTYSYESRVVGMLPPVHVLLLDPRYMVKDVTTAFEVISRVFKEGYMGFITGPSRTADIERVLSLGVHGPGRLIVMAVESGLETREGQVH